MKLGQKVMVQSRMVRRNDWRPIGSGFIGKAVHKEWFSVPIAPRECLVVGKRTIQSGYVDSHEDGIDWIPQKFIKAFLVVHDMNRAPFYVLAEDLEPKAVLMEGKP
jgi:hypothetical protein